jgi:transcriptional regulator with XRE-family HTH domain
MKLTKLISDDVVLGEIGQRIARIRVNSQLTQADLAKQAGVSKRTVERFEGGQSAQMSSVIRIFRVLDLLPNVDRMIPEPGIRPMELVKLKGKVRKRASSPRARGEQEVTDPPNPS